MLVTGGTGFIGSVLCKKLVEKGYSVKTLVLPGENINEKIGPGITVVRGDLTDIDSLYGICDGVDMVFHLAARVTDWGSKQAFYSSIYNCSENLLKVCKNYDIRFIYLSSIAACGLGKHLKGFKETDTPAKSGVPYNDAKLDTEKLVMYYHKHSDLNCTIIRPGNTIGPDSVWVTDIVEKFKYIIPLFDSGKHSSSLIYVDNLVDGIILSSEAEVASGQIYHLRDDWDISWKKYVNDIGAVLDKKTFGTIPFFLAWRLGTIFELFLTPFNIRPPITRLSVGVMGRNNDVDNSKAKKELGWETKISYSEGMEKITLWMKQELL